MLAYERKNMVLLGLVQIGVVFEGIACCGLSVRLCGRFGVADFFLNYGALFLIVPVMWMTQAIYYCEKENSTPLREGFFYLAGMLLAVLPALYFFFLAFAPIIWAEGCRMSG